MSLSKSNLMTRSALVVGLVMIGFAGPTQAAPPGPHAVGGVRVEAPRPVIPERLRPVDVLRIQSERVVLTHPEAREFMSKTLLEGGTYNGKSIEFAVKDIDTKMEALKKGRPEKDLSDKEQKDLAELERQRQDILEKVMKKFVEKDEKSGEVAFRFQKEGSTAIEKAREIFKAIRTNEKAVIEAMKDGKAYRLNDAQNEIVFANAVKGMLNTFGVNGSPAQKNIMKTVDRYLSQISEKTPEGGIKFTKKPSVALLENVERAMKALDGASTAEAKSGSEWRTNFDATSPENIATAASELKWGDTQHDQIEEILTDADAARGLGRFAGFHNRVAKSMGRAKNTESDPAKDPAIGKAVDMWVVAPEVLKKQLMAEKELDKFNENPEKYVEEFEKKLLADHNNNENDPAVKKYREEKKENEELLKKLCKNCPKLFPNACAIAAAK